MNVLLSFEAGLNKLPLSALDLSCGDNDPDGGVDAIVQWLPGTAHDVLTAGENALQYKSGSFAIRGTTSS
jgi:hypothetical protein